MNTVSDPTSREEPGQLELDSVGSPAGPQQMRRFRRVGIDAVVVNLEFWGIHYTLLCGKSSLIQPAMVPRGNWEK